MAGRVQLRLFRHDCDADRRDHPDLLRSWLSGARCVAGLFRSMCRGRSNAAYSLVCGCALPQGSTVEDRAFIVKGAQLKRTLQAR